jgi:hypothetical protein
MTKHHKQPKVGEFFEHRYKGTLYRLNVVQTDNGLAYELLGKVYSSPTAAAKSVVGPQYINGRKFWHMDEYN